MSKTNKIKVKQRDIMDYGAACLMSISAFYKLHIPVSKIRQYANTDKKGTNVLGMVEAAEKMGFIAKGVKGEYDSLLKIPKPAVAHFHIKADNLLHYVVILKATQEYVEIMDPAFGEISKLSKDEFTEKWTGVLILLVPGDTFEEKNERVSNLKRLFYLLRPHQTIMTQALIGAVFFSIIGLSTSVYIQKLTDFVFVNGNKNLLNLMSIAMIILIVLQMLLGIFQSVFTIKTGQLIDARLILGYYKHLLKLPQRFFDTMRTGEIVSRINDAVKIRAFINNTLIDLIVNILIVVFSFVLMFVYSWKMALIVMIIIPLYGVLYYLINRLNKKTERKIMEQSAHLESHLVESINTVHTIKRFGIESYFDIQTENKFVQLLNTGYKSALNSVFSSFTATFFSRVFTIIVLWSGSYFVLANQLTPGELMSFYAILGYFTGPLSSLINVNKTIQNAFIASDRLFEIMDLEQEEQQQKIELNKQMLGNINFRNVDFRYGTRVDVFKNFNLQIDQGKTTAIVGESGSGKTTLISLLQNIYPIQSGNIEISAYNLKNISNDSLRSIVGVVPQQIDLFAGNVLSNIAIGDFEPDIKRISDICNMLGITEFIESLPEGYQTYIGENGASLSGGEKQRIAIARALYKQPEILILDEATSSLDSASEQYIKRAIDVLKQQNKTIILIAHRLSTIMQADKIVVLQKGKIMEMGNHKELMNNQQNYYKLWQQQFAV